MARRSAIWQACVLVLLALVSPALAADEDLRVKAVRPDGTFTASIPGGVEVRGRDVYVVSRGGKPLGDCMVVSVKGGEAVLIPKASFKGAPRPGDALSFSRHAEALGKEVQWVRFKPADGSYSVLFPEMPGPKDIETKQETQSSGPMSRTIIGVADRAQGMYYELVVSDYTLVKKEGYRYYGDEDQLNSGISSIETRLHWKVRSTRNCELNGYSGREVEAVTDKNSVVRMRMYIVETRRYLLMATASKAGVSSNATRFLDSLEISRKKQTR